MNYNRSTPKLRNNMTNRIWLAALLLVIFCHAEVFGQPVLLDDQFDLPAGFHIYKAASADLAGGSYDLALDGEGRLLVGDGESVRRLTDTDGDQVYDQQEVIAEGLGPRGPQGLLVYGDRLYAVGGDGIQVFTGYQNGGPLEHQGRVGEPFHTGGDHSAHAVLRGLDGYVYFITGDGGETSDRRHITQNSSPVIYEREGSVFRFDPTGKWWECIGAGGRNSPNLGMNYLGKFFSFASDVEWHIALPWYRPVRLNHWAIGGDQGWQKVGAYPPYYLDCLPPILEVGRGSPNWGTFYEHRQFPESYRDSFICCDYRWKSATTGVFNSSGRLVVFHMTRDGATWKATMETLAKCKAHAQDQDGLAISFALVDVDVAPDGSILITDHNQGVWRIFYDQATTPAIPPIVPHEAFMTEHSTLLRQLLSLPQPAAEWSRTREQKIIAQLGNGANVLLQSVATNNGNHTELTVRQRLRAIRYLAKDFGVLDNAFLKSLAHDEAPEIRGQAAWLIGIRGTDVMCPLLINLLMDPDPFVRRRAAEAMGRIDTKCGQEELVRCMGDPDRWVQYAAMTAIAHHPLAEWIDLAMDAKSPRIWMRALTAGSIRRESPQDAWVANIVSRLLEAELTDKADQLDRLRVLSLCRSQISRIKELEHRVTAHIIAGLAATDRDIRWEHVQLLAEYNVASSISQLLDLLETERDYVTQFHIAQSLSRIRSGWNAATESRIMRWLVTNQTGWFAEFDDKGRKFPLFRLAMLGRLVEGHANALARNLDRLIPGSQLSSLAYGEVATTEVGRRQLFEIHKNTDDAQVRREILKGFSQHILEPKYWPMMSVALESESQNDFLCGVDWLANQGPSVKDFYRGMFERTGGRPDGEQRLIHRMIESLEQGHNELYRVDRALRSFASEEFDRQRDFHSDEVRLAAAEHWQAWYRDRYGVPFVRSVSTDAAEIMSDAQVHALILTEDKQGDVDRGRNIYLQANCYACHGGLQSKEVAIFGPDLGGVTQRLNQKELADALVYPSKQVAQRFKSSLIITGDGRSLSGVITETTENDLTLVDSDNRIQRNAKSNIQSSRPLDTSPMPDKLLNGYSKQQIKDLLRFLESL